MNKYRLHRKRRFYFFLVLAIALSSSKFYSGYQFGKMAGRKELIDYLEERKDEKENQSYDNIEANIF